MRTTQTRVIGAQGEAFERERAVRVSLAYRRRPLWQLQVLDRLHDRRHKRLLESRHAGEVAPPWLQRAPIGRTTKPQDIRPLNAKSVVNCLALLYKYTKTKGYKALYTFA
jgi:hypothetical protein